MQVELSADEKLAPVIQISAGHRLAMVAMAYLPFCFCLSVLSLIGAALSGLGPRWLLAAAIGVLYLLPPLAVFPLRLKNRLKATRVPIESGAFLSWWYVAQWQVVFNRLPILEEILRLVPGAYSTWLRLWGAKIGKLVYWSPGMRISDRPFVEIGDRTVIGLDTKLYAHFLSKSTTGATELCLAPIQIGHDVLIGGCSLLTAGVQVASCEQTRPVRPLAPFSHYRAGRCMRDTRFIQEGQHDQTND